MGTPNVWGKTFRFCKLVWKENVCDEYVNDVGF